MDFRISIPLRSLGRFTDGAWMRVFLSVVAICVSVHAVRAEGTAQLNPEHEEILAAAGWLDYVRAQIDVIRYHDAVALRMSNGRLAVGIASAVNGLRIADIATRDKSGLDICATLVHEAAHLEGIRVIRWTYPQLYAEAMERRFLQDQERTTGRGKTRTSTWLWKRN